MSQPVIQTSFNAGEWAPALNARVDLAKYHSGAALLRNFFVDYRGGATFRAGTKYVIQTFNSTQPVRVIPFQASFSVSYAIEVGQGYMRFINNGAPVLEAAKAITAVNPGTGTFTSNAHGYSAGDWIFISGVVGTLGAAINGNYYIVQGPTANTFGIGDLNGVSQIFPGLVYTSGGTAQRIYTIVSPYQGNEVFGIRYSQNSNILILCHPNYPPYVLTLNAATNWTLAAITIGPTILAPSAGLAASSSLGAGTWNYAYVVTSVDANGQESGPSVYATIASVLDLRQSPGTNTVTWTAVAGAASYNIYKAVQRTATPVPAGSFLGFAGNVTGNTFYDSNIIPDFSQGPPVVINPFSGTGVQSISLTAPGTYAAGTTAPVVTLTGGGGSGAAALLTMGAKSIVSFSSGGTAYSVGDIVNLTYGIVIQVTAVSFKAITAANIIFPGTFAGGSALPFNPYPQVSTSGVGSGCLVNFNFQVTSVSLTNPGTGYSPAPAVNFSAGGGAAATAILGAPSSGNPTVPSFFQQRLVLAGPVSNPQQLNMSTTGAQFNFNNHNPIQADDAIQATLVSGQLNTIQSLVSQPQGLLSLTDKAAWLLNGGSPGAAITPSALVANAHSYNGASNLPAIVANDNILYVQAKGSIVRDLTYNFYTAIYTGADISILSSHLFYGFTLVDWARCEEPFKVIWCVRNDGQLLALTFLKEQELIAWSHSDTQGFFKSVASITETVTFGNVDALYTVVQRNINGNTVQYIERMTELYYPTGVTDGWNVDAGIQFNGTATLAFAGAQHLANTTVTGLATDNNGNVTVIAPFAVAANGTFTLPAPALPATGYTRVTIGLGYLGQVQTLPLDLGEPTVQGKRKKVAAVTVRCKDTLGLSTGRSFSTLVPMKDLVIGNVGTMSNKLVTDLVTSDCRTIVDPQYDVFGQFCIQQSNPYPTSILGVVPEITVGDDA